MKPIIYNPIFDCCKYIDIFIISTCNFIEMKISKMIFPSRLRDEHIDYTDNMRSKRPHCVTPHYNKTNEKNNWHLRRHFHRDTSIPRWTTLCYTYIRRVVVRVDIYIYIGLATFNIHIITAYNMSVELHQSAYCTYILYIII